MAKLSLFSNLDSALRFDRGKFDDCSFPGAGFDQRAPPLHNKRDLEGTFLEKLNLLKGGDYVFDGDFFFLKPSDLCYLDKRSGEWITIGHLLSKLVRRRLPKNYYLSGVRALNAFLNIPGLEEEGSSRDLSIDCLIFPGTTFSSEGRNFFPGIELFSPHRDFPEEKIWRPCKFFLDDPVPDCSRIVIMSLQ